MVPPGLGKCNKKPGLNAVRQRCGGPTLLGVFRGPVQQSDPLFLRPFADQSEAQWPHGAGHLIFLGYEQTRGDEKPARLQSRQDERTPVDDAPGRDIGHCQVELTRRGGRMGY